MLQWGVMGWMGFFWGMSLRWWLGVWWAINAAADRWRSERPPGTWITAGKWLQWIWSWSGGSAWVRGRERSVNEIKMHRESRWREKKRVLGKEHLSIYLPPDSLLGRPCWFTILPQLIVSSKLLAKPWRQTVKSVHHLQSHNKYWHHESYYFLQR